MEYNGKFGHTIGRIQHISLMSRLDIFNIACSLSTQTVANTLLDYQGIKPCIKYLVSQPIKPMFYPSNYYESSNVIRLTWSWNQVEEYTTYNCL